MPQGEPTKTPTPAPAPAPAQGLTTPNPVPDPNPPHGPTPDPNLTRRHACSSTSSRSSSSSRASPPTTARLPPRRPRRPSRPSAPGAREHGHAEATRPVTCAACAWRGARHPGMCSCRARASEVHSTSRARGPWAVGGGTWGCTLALAAGEQGGIWSLAWVHAMRVGRR